METLDLSHSVPDYQSACGISGRLNLPSPAVEVISKWLVTEEEGDDSEFIEMLKETGWNGSI